MKPCRDVHVVPDRVIGDARVGGQMQEGLTRQHELVGQEPPEREEPPAGVVPLRRDAPHRLDDQAFVDAKRTERSLRAARGMPHKQAAAAIGTDLRLGSVALRKGQALDCRGVLVLSNGVRVHLAGCYLAA